MPGETKNETPQGYETEPNKNGIKTVVSYRYDEEEGVTYKITKKVKVTNQEVRIPKAVLERKRNWKKFGGPAKTPLGSLETGVTYFGEECSFEAVKDSQQKEEKKDKVELATITCRHCGGAHWSHKCTRAPVEEAKPEHTSLRPGSYVPPNKRGGARYEDPEKQVTTLRVSNMSENITEDDLRSTFSPFGYITRIHLARDRQTNVPRGFAYVTFEDRETAERAKSKTVGIGLDHMIWS